MAVKRLASIKPGLSADNQGIANDLLNFMKKSTDDVVQGAWFPDSIIKDNSTGHVWRYRPPGHDEPATSREHNLPVMSSVLKFLGPAVNKSEPVVLQKNDSLADRCQSLAYSIRDELQVGWEVGHRQKDIGSPVITRNNHLSLLFFMLSHYVADGHMPLHCDARRFKDSIHSHMEALWESNVRRYYEFEDDPGMKTQQRFLIDRNGFAVIKDKEKQNFQESLLGKVWEELDRTKGRFTLGYGKRNYNVWDYMADVCFFSYLLSARILPPSEIAQPGRLSIKEFNAEYMADFEKASVSILADTIDSVTRIWFNIWKAYEKMGIAMRSNWQ